MDYTHILTCMDGLCHPPFFFFPLLFRLSSFVFSNFLLVFPPPAPLSFISLRLHFMPLIHLSTSASFSYIIYHGYLSYIIMVTYLYIQFNIPFFSLLVSMFRSSDFDFDYDYGFLYALCALALFLSISLFKLKNH